MYPDLAIKAYKYAWNYRHRLLYWLLLVHFDESYLPVVNDIRQFYVWQTSKEVVDLVIILDIYYYQTHSLRLLPLNRSLCDGIFKIHLKGFLKDQVAGFIVLTIWNFVKYEI